MRNCHFGVLALLTLQGCAANSTWAPAADITAFETRLEQIRANHNIPGMSAAIAKDQQVVWARGFGFADVEAQRPATETTAYHLASLTKTFASTILLELVQAGRLDLDAPVSNFGVDIQSPGIITVRHLFTHTSQGTPGAAFQYNGDRYAALGNVIQSVTDTSFGMLLQRRIIGPLALRHTAPNPNDQNAFLLSGMSRTAFLGNLAQGYTSDGQSRQAYPGIFSVSAGLTASAVDMAQYSMALDRNQFVSAQTQALAWTPYVTTGGQATPYGLGWFVTTIGGRKIVWHYGYWTANSSLIIKAPEMGLTLVLLANTDMLSRPNNLGSGDLMSSVVAREFINAFVTGTTPLP